MSNQSFSLSETCTLLIEDGDITEVAVDAIVNAANSRMLGGGGVDGAIHLRAGPRLLEACQQVEEVMPGVRCPVGEARITPGFDLPSDYVIHTVGPIFVSHEESSGLLASAYEASTDLANAHNLRRIAFPAVSCGVFGYPMEAAARVAIETCQASHGKLEEIRFVLFGTESFDCWRTVAKALIP